MSDATTARRMLAIEQSLRLQVPEAIFAAPRVVRRIIRADQGLPLMFARVPHPESIALPPARLLLLADDVWALPAELPDTVLLVARPDPLAGAAPAPGSPGGSGAAEELAARAVTAGPTGEISDPLVRGYWRRLYHGCLDIAIRRSLAGPAADGATFASLVHAVGETAFDEARGVLAKEGLVRHGAGVRECFAEFAALVLELAAFDPAALPIWFPALERPAVCREQLARLVDADRILERTCPRPQPAREPLRQAPTPGPDRQPLAAPPPGIREQPPRPAAAGRPFETPANHPGQPSPLSRLAERRLRARAASAARRGNDVRAALFLWRLREQLATSGAADEVHQLLEQRVEALVRRLEAAGGLLSGEEEVARRIVAALVERSGGSAWSQAARLLYDLQKSRVDAERESYRTRLLWWACSLGRIALIRPLPSQRIALIHRHLAAAARRLPATGLPGGLQAAAAALLQKAVAASERRLRARLGPEIRRVVSAAGLVPATLVEDAALDTLVDEILDGIAQRGFESFGALRDAVSRNQLKLADLAGVGELLGGDALLRADRRLAAALDGAYRPAPVYLLAMQRLSAVAFGIRAGRAVTLHLLLPFGGAWILWKFLEHVVELVSEYSLGTQLHVYSRTGVLLTGVGIWLLMHLEGVRAAARGLIRTCGLAIHLALIELPRRLLAWPVVDAVLRSRPVRFFRRHLWSPLVVTGLVWICLPHGRTTWSRGNPQLPAVVFLASLGLLNSPLGRLVEERVLEAVARVLRQLHAHLVVGLLALIVDLSRQAIDLVEGTLYAVDEQLRFRADEPRLALAAKAVLTTLWSGVDWVARFCVTLLIEPQLNPLKHFPVVTVSHKLLLPMIPMVAGQLALATGMQRRLALTTVTAVSAAIPGVFGFLAWELKENWRLYAANRPRILLPVQVGRHGETMRRLLVPGFHSGTIPRLFARLRNRAGRAAASTPDPREATPSAEIEELARAIAAFVDDACLGLVRRTRAWAGIPVRVAAVRLATNRVAIDLEAGWGPDRVPGPHAAEADAPPAGPGWAEFAGGPLQIEIVQGGGLVSSRLVAVGWLDGIAADRRRVLRRALAGLDCLCGVDFVIEEADGLTSSRPVEPIEWAAWRDAWERDRAPPA